MRALIRLGQVHRTPLLIAILAGVAVLSLTAGPHRAPNPPTASDKRVRIVVDSIVGRLGGDPGKITLADALARAARDPSDNLILFHTALAERTDLVIRLATPIVVDGTTGGHDYIDGIGMPSGIILDISACSDAGLTVGAGREFTLENLTLRGGGQRAVLLKDNAQLRLDQVNVIDSGGPGVAAFGQSRLTATRCRFRNNKTHAVELHGDATAAIETCTLQANGQSGLAGFNRSIATLKDCCFEDNGEWNAVLTHSARGEFTACQLRRGRFAGLDLSESASAVCRDCTIEESRRFGVFATNRASAELTKTRVRKSSGRGVELQEQAVLSLGESVIENSGEYGLILFGASAVRAEGALFSGNGAHGASLRGTSAGEFIGCAFTRNRYSGLGAPDAGQGGRLRASHCVFMHNGMRPIYRGPLHIDPMVPMPLSVDGPIVECAADPNATIELYLDRAGEAGKYLKTVRADARGRFTVSCADVPDGCVMTAAATVNDSTSEFNVIAGARAQALMSALLARTGPFSDAGGRADLASAIRRWKPGTRLILQLQEAPSAAVDRYVRHLVAQVNAWTRGAVTAEARIGQPATGGSGVVVVPVHYVGPNSPQLKGLGGVTYMKWDRAGYFQPPMEIVLAQAGEAEDTCPRVLAHEFGHALGLNHTRVGLLSRMQGKIAPGQGFVNDFAPVFTYYDVLALQMLYDPRNQGGVALSEALERGVRRTPRTNVIVDAAVGEIRPRGTERAGATGGRPEFSPSPRPATPKPRTTRRGR